VEKKTGNGRFENTGGFRKSLVIPARRKGKKGMAHPAISMMLKRPGKKKGRKEFTPLKKSLKKEKKRKGKRPDP